MSSPEINIDKAAAALCRKRFSFFVKEFWHTVVAEDLVWSPHMDVLCDEIQVVYERVAKRQKKEYDLIINIPPGTSKSTIITIMAPAWSWTIDPSLRHITGSYSDSLSTEHAVKSRDIVESDLYRKYFPEVEIKYDKGLKTNYETTKLGQRKATSVGGTITGIHAHIITVDDPINPKQAASQLACTNANNWMDKTLSMRKVNKAVTLTVLVMQRLATNDPTGYLLGKGKTNIRHICLPAELSPTVKPESLKEIYREGLLDPIRLSRDVLDEAKTDLGEDGYAGQMMQTPVKEGGLIWQKWFREIDDDIFPHTSHMTQVGSDWDLAYTEKETNAACAYFSAGKIDGYAYIFDFDFAHLEFPEMIRYIKARRGPHYIEAKASGKSARQVLVRNGIPAIEVQVQGGSDKIARAKMATPPAQAGLVFIKKSLADKLYNHSHQGILNFPKSPHKDVADALAQCLQRLFKSSPITSSGRRSILDGIS